MTRGRRSGREHEVTLWFAYADGLLWLRADQRSDGRGPDWHRNLLRHPQCVVRADGYELHARYEPTAADEGTLRRLVELWRAKYGAMWVQDWYVERGRLPVTVRPALPAGGSTT